MAPGLLALWTGISFLGDWHFVAVLAPLAALLVYFGISQYSALIFVGALAASEALVFVLKILVHKPRPLNPLITPEDPYSFPSGHSNIAVVLYGMIAFFLFKHFSGHPVAQLCIVVSAVALALLIGSSRIALQVHFPEDVLAGFSIGIVFLGVAIWLLQG